MCAMHLFIHKAVFSFILLPNKKNVVQLFIQEVKDKIIFQLKGTELTLAVLKVRRLIKVTELLFREAYYRG